MKSEKQRFFGRHFLVFFVFLSMTLPAWGDSEITASTDLTFTLSTIPEAKIGVSQSFTFPFLRGNGFLTSENNIKTVLAAELSPVSVNGIAEVAWTPIAFFQLIAGVRGGSGWNINLLGADVIGMGINRPKKTGKTAEVVGSPLDGLIRKINLGGALQFDAGVLFADTPRADWFHVIFRTYHEINHRAYTQASEGDSWYFENDFGENRNGYSYYGNFLLGYQMPLFLNMAAFMAEIDQYLYDAPKGDRWGDDMGRWTFSGVLNFSISPRFGATVITQFRTMRNYTDKNAESIFYQNRHLDDSEPLRLEFYRVAAILSFKVR
jgi:hypothetical protein